MGWGQAFDSASSCWYRSVLGCWLSLRSSLLSLLVHEMTPPPPRCTSLGAPRYRVPGSQARSGLPLQLLLLLLWAAADTQGHPKSGPRISAVWKGRWHARGGGGARDPMRVGAECAAPVGVRARGSVGPGCYSWGECGSG